MAKRGQAVRPTGRKVPTKLKRAPAEVDLKKEIATLRLELAEALETANRYVRGSSGHQQFAGRAGAGFPEDARERDTRLRGQVRPDASA